jgi:hypothetical protein
MQADAGSHRTITRQFTTYSGPARAQVSRPCPRYSNLAQMQACNGQAPFGLRLRALNFFVYHHVLDEIGVALQI